MKRGQFRIRLRPYNGGAFTQVQLYGYVPTAIPARLAKRLTSLLTFWSGWPVALALCVDTATVGWCEQWADCVQDVPVHHLEVRFVPSPARHIVRGQAGDRHEP